MSTIKPISIGLIVRHILLFPFLNVMMAIKNNIEGRKKREKESLNKKKHYAIAIIIVACYLRSGVRGFGV